MMSERRTLDLAVSVRAALVENDLLAAQAAFDDASLLRMPGKSGLAGQYQGRDAILGLCSRMSQLTDGTLQFTPARVISEDDQAMVVFGREYAARGGRKLDTDAIHIVLLRDRRVREVWVLHEHQDPVDEFWAS
jgi:ketosteroid isomerase-like protein